MNSAAAVELLRNVLQALQFLAFLNITSFLYPDSAQVTDGATFDFIVVGAGTAGAVVAARLAEDQKTSVLLIEAGDNPPDECHIPSLMIYLGKTNYDWNYISKDDGVTQRCQQNHTVDLLLGKVLGGTSSSNFLLFSMGYHGDYDNWANIVDDKSWTWAALKKYFKKAFRFDQKPFMSSLSELYTYYGSHGKLGLMKDVQDFNSNYLKGFEETGNKIIPFISERNPTGYTTAIYNIDQGVRQNSASYLTAIKDNTNLYVLKNTVAKAILFDENKNAVGVEIVTKDGKTIKVKSRYEVIISAGAINSPKLLMLSGIGPKEHLESKGIKVVADLPVGQNLQDHVATVIIHNMTKLEGSNKTRDSRQYPAKVFSGYVNLNKKKDAPEYSTTNFINYAHYLVQFCRVTYGFQDSICDAMFDFPNTNEMIFSVIVNLSPISRGEVLLQSACYTDAPIVETGYFSEEKDLENQVKFIENFVLVTNSSNFKKAGAVLVDPKLSCCAEYEFGCTEYWRCYAKCMMMTRRHYAGTNAMGSVVDSKLKVIGVGKLRVVDASVMPVIPKGPTMAPTVVIGEKAADFIKKDHKL